MKRIINKVRSQKAFSMGEMLVACLILGLMTLALAAGISTSLRVYGDSVNYSEKRMLLATMAESIASELRYSKEAKLSAVDEAKFQLDRYTSMNYGFNCSFEPVDDTVRVKNNNRDTSFDLLGDGVYSKNKLKVEMEAAEDGSPSKILYDKDKGCYQFTIAVYVRNNENDPGERRTITVKPFEAPVLPS